MFTEPPQPGRAHLRATGRPQQLLTGDSSGSPVWQAITDAPSDSGNRAGVRRGYRGLANVLGDGSEGRLTGMRRKATVTRSCHPGSEAPPAEKTVGHAEGTAGTAQVHHDERSAPEHRRRLLLVWGSLSAVLVTAAVATIVLVLNGSSSPSTTFPSPYHHPSTPPIASVARTYPEEEFTPNGAPTFLYLDGSGPGIPVAFGQYVRVSCKVYSTDVRTTWPDGHWYRLASMPWDNHYFAVANTFGNGDKLGKPPYTHNVDWRVPNCK